MKRVVKCDGEQMCGMSESFSRLHYHYRAANFLKKTLEWERRRFSARCKPGVTDALLSAIYRRGVWKRTNASRTKIRFFFGVRNWMCGVRACENMQKRVSHGETVRVGSSVIIMRGNYGGIFCPPLRDIRGKIIFLRGSFALCPRVFPTLSTSQ